MALVKEGLWDIVTGTETFLEGVGVTDEGYMCSGTSKNVQSSCHCRAYAQWHNNHSFKSYHSNVLCPPAMYCVSTETGAMLVTNKIAVFRMDIDSKYCSQYFTYKNVIIISKTLYNQK